MLMEILSVFPSHPLSRIIQKKPRLSKAVTPLCRIGESSAGFLSGYSPASAITSLRRPEFELGVEGDNAACRFGSKILHLGDEWRTSEGGSAGTYKLRPRW